MFPEFYQTVLQRHLSQSQYLTLQLLVLLLQSCRQVRLSRLASVFPQPIRYQSRLRNLQRFLVLPQLSVRLLWFPIIKYWIRQEYKDRKPNRAQQRRLKKLQHKKYGYLVIAIDRTQWEDRNLFVASVVWGKHALPIYWELIDTNGNSSLAKQKAVLRPVLKLLKPFPVVVVGDREFHSPKLATWLYERGVDFALRQKKSCNMQEPDSEYQALKSMGFRPGMSKFFQDIFCHKTENLGPFNMAICWKRKYRGKGPKEPWYILTSLPTLKQTLDIYKARWGIEMMFKDCKTGGYNLEDTKVNDTRFLALFLLIAIAYSLAICQGEFLKVMGVQEYICRIEEAQRREPRHSDFWIGLYGQAWGYAMRVWSQLATDLMILKPHKRLYFQRGLSALSLIPSAV